MASAELQDFFAVLRGGDQESVGRLLDEVEPFLRRVIHLRLLDGRLGHITDTTDVLQSLLRDFLVQAVCDHEEVPAGGGLRAYLAAAVRYKILRRLRDESRHTGGLPEGCRPVSPEPSPDRLAEFRDLLDVIRARLPERSQRLLGLRAQGRTWAEIADHEGGEHNVLRIRLARDMAGVLDRLDLTD
jgi:DNA-directed RNA polymerase specialized sigma24 family protein